MAVSSRLVQWPSEQTQAWAPETERSPPMGQVQGQEAGGAHLHTPGPPGQEGPVQTGVGQARFSQPCWAVTLRKPPGANASSPDCNFLL